MEQRKPEWLKIKVQANEGKNDVERLLRELALSTVCKEARCPNLMECYGRRTATFLILGRNCTRNCRFCNIQMEYRNRSYPTSPSGWRKQ